MAKWGRRGWLLRPLSRNRSSLWPSRSFRRVKTVSWGSRNTSSKKNRSGGKWQSTVRPAKPFQSQKKSAWGGMWQPKRVQSFRAKPLAVSKRTSSTGAGGNGGWGSKPKPARRKRRIWIIALLLSFFLIGIQSVVYIDKHLRPPLMKVAQIRIKQIATQAINEATTEKVAGQSDFEKLIDWKMNSDGKVSGFMLNYAEHTKIRAQTIQTVQATLSHLKEIPERIPVGNALGSPIISSYGPRIPVKFEPVGAVKVDLNTRQKNAGINMILIEVYIRIMTEVAIIVPFETEPQLVETEIPISYLLVVGDVPMYYYDNKGNPVGDSAHQAPNIALPLKEGEGISKPSDGSMIEEYLESPSPAANESGGSGGANNATGAGN
ncbi:sporulation protein YunB [Paenibacillus sp. NPDC058071]|uniref:sporulation protein YunB n=1 Tax=Paenibacillus sp. NPDC058071 TaxID=3346326 RepID=UPI0036D81F9A